MEELATESQITLEIIDQKERNSITSLGAYSEEEFEPGLNQSMRSDSIISEGYYNY